MDMTVQGKCWSLAGVENLWLTLQFLSSMSGIFKHDKKAADSQKEKSDWLFANWIHNFTHLYCGFFTFFILFATNFIKKKENTKQSNIFE